MFLACIGHPTTRPPTRDITPQFNARHCGCFRTFITSDGFMGLIHFNVRLVPQDKVSERSIEGQRMRRSALKGAVLGFVTAGAPKCSVIAKVTV